MFESERIEGRDRWRQREDAIGRGTRAVGQPDAEAQQGIAQHAEQKGFCHAEFVDPGRRAQQRGTDRSAGLGMLAGEDQQATGDDGPKEIADEHDPPGAQQPAGGQAPMRPGHHHEHVGREQFGATDDRQYVGQRERESAGELGDADRERTAEAGRGSRGESRTESDVRAGKAGQREQAETILACLLGAGTLGILRHIFRQYGINGTEAPSVLIRFLDHRGLPLPAPARPYQRPGGNSARRDPTGARRLRAGRLYGVTSIRSVLPCARADRDPAMVHGPPEYCPPSARGRWWPGWRRSPPDG